MADGKKKPLARSLGEFFGILWDAAKTDVSKPAGGAPGGAPATVVRKDVQEQTVETPRGAVTLRRTTIDEIEPAAPSRSREALADGPREQSSEGPTPGTCSPQDPDRKT